MKNKNDHISRLITELRQQGPVFFLESQMQEHPASQSSFIAAQPKAIIKAYGNKIEFEEGEESFSFVQNPWKALEEFKNEHGDWLFGYLGYDLKNHDETLTSKNDALIDAPDLYFMIPDLVIEIDAEQTLIPIKGTLPELKTLGDNAAELKLNVKHKLSEENYLSMIERSKKDIYEGDYYEINLSHALQFEMEGDSWQLYEQMKKAGPVPFGGYADLKGLEICCASPERFLARNGRHVWSQPIKGTASRKQGMNAESDIARLKSSEKERAENLMIVDLVRNDLSRVALKNTVRVSNLFEIQSFETVHQMVSTVECEVQEATESLDVIKACFPMGSMTGAPKIAAMKAIDGYENYRRGIYSGALGYIKPNDDFDFNVVIRTALIQDGKLIYPVGGAITSDSDPKAEWEETFIKAQAITSIFQELKKPE